jgi:hypothetical protein
MKLLKDMTMPELNGASLLALAPNANHYGEINPAPTALSTADIRSFTPSF